MNILDEIVSKKEQELMKQNQLYPLKIFKINWKNYLH